MGSTKTTEAEIAELRRMIATTGTALDAATARANAAEADARAIVAEQARYTEALWSEAAPFLPRACVGMTWSAIIRRLAEERAASDARLFAARREHATALEAWAR